MSTFDKGIKISSVRAMARYYYSFSSYFSTMSQALAKMKKIPTQESRSTAIGHHFL